MTTQQIGLGDLVATPSGETGRVVHLYTNDLGERIAYIRTTGLHSRKTYLPVARLTAVELPASPCAMPLCQQPAERDAYYCADHRAPRGY